MKVFSVLNFDDYLNGYLEILITPLPWLVIVLWYLILGLTVLFIAKALSKNELKCKRIFTMVGLYTGFGFCVEMLKGLVFLCISLFFYYYEYNMNKTKLFSIDIHESLYFVLNTGFTITDIIFMILCAFITIGFWFLIYFFVMRKAAISKRLKIITSVILAVFSGAYYLLYL